MGFMSELQSSGFYIERRRGIDRRQFKLSSYVYGSLHPRRRGGRRMTDRHYPVVDWHPARIFAAAALILFLCAVDAVMTIVLITNGAIEANPFMAMILPKGLGWFAAVKLLLTGIGCCVLVACSRMRLFRSVPGEVMLYGVAAVYIALIVYELRLLDRVLDPALAGTG
jgi:Domain of unknown function (DUF5658)